MATPNRHFKAVLAHLGISNLELAKALDYDPSLISRYVTGHRVFRAASRQMDEICDYLLSRAANMKDIDWLKAQFIAAGLPTDLSTIHRLKQNLIMWLATDGEPLRKNLGRVLPGDLAGTMPMQPLASPPDAALHQGEALLGTLALVYALRSALTALDNGAGCSVFLSSDRLSAVVHPDMLALLHERIAQSDLHLTMVVCVSGDTQAMSHLLDSYMKPLITGHVKLFVVHGLTQTVTSTMHILLPGGTCFLIHEIIGAASPPVAIVIREQTFAAEAVRSFEASARYAQPVLSVYGDAYTRDVIEILALEYCTPGALDVVKDSLNPMFMSLAAYDRFLSTRGHSQPEFAWRSAEFARFKAGMDGNLHSGTAFREILSLVRLNEIAQRGSCRMAGLYFAERGYIDLDRKGCIDILNGYISYLENEPRFSLLILDSLDALHGNNCWHIKQNSHISINNWQGATPVMVHSDQLMLLREFQAHYDALWAKGTGMIGSRANGISILKDVIERLEKSTMA